VSRKSSSLSAAAAEVTTLPTVVIAATRKKLKLPLQTERMTARLTEPCIHVPVAPKTALAKTPPEQENLGPSWNHIVRSGCVVNVPPTPKPTPISSTNERQAKRQAAPVSGQGKPERLEASVVEQCAAVPAVQKITHVKSGCSLPAAASGNCKFHNPSSFAFGLEHLGALVTGKVKKTWGFHFSPTTTEH
jgi:hypothetical protein